MPTCACMILTLTRKGGQECPRKVGLHDRFIENVDVRRIGLSVQNLGKFSTKELRWPMDEKNLVEVQMEVPHDSEND